VLAEVGRLELRRGGASLPPILSKPILIQPPSRYSPPTAGALRFSESFSDPVRLLAVAGDVGLEGVVSKRRDAPYHSGRTLAWIKVKTERWRLANRERWRLFGERRR
jgi:hypothetical protein